MPNDVIDAYATFVEFSVFFNIFQLVLSWQEVWKKNCRTWQLVGGGPAVACTHFPGHSLLCPKGGLTQGHVVEWSEEIVADDLEVVSSCILSMSCFIQEDKGTYKGSI